MGRLTKSEQKNKKKRRSDANARIKPKKNYVTAPKKPKSELQIIKGEGGKANQKRTPLQRVVVKTTQKSQKARVTTKPTPVKPKLGVPAPTGAKIDHKGRNKTEKPEKLLIKLKPNQRLLPKAKVKIEPIKLKDHKGTLEKLGDAATAPTKFALGNTGKALGVGEKVLKAAEANQRAQSKLLPRNNRKGLLGGIQRATAPSANPGGGKTVVTGTKAATRRAKNIAIATKEDGDKVAVSTAKSLPAIAAGTVGFGGSVVKDALHGSTKTLRSVPKGIEKDYKRRYGASDKEQQKQIKNEGIAADVADATIVVGGTGAVVGRALTPIAKTGRLGKFAKASAGERRKLKISGEESVPQKRSKNLFTAAAQEARDANRARVSKKRANVSGDERKRGLQPAEGEVVHTQLKRQARSQRKSISKDQSRGHLHYRGQAGQEVHEGIRNERAQARKSAKKSGVSKNLWNDVETLATEGHINFDSPAKTDRLLALREKKITATRAERGTKVPKGRSATNDDLARVRRVRAALKQNPSAVLSQELRDFHGKQIQRKVHLRGSDTTIKNLEAEVRAWGPIGRTLGIHQKLEKIVDGLETKKAEGKITPDEFDSKVVAAQQQFVKRTYVAARKHGLAEPAYVQHIPDNRLRASNFTAGHKAMAAPHQTKYSLFDQGIQNTTPDAYDQGIARTIKRNTNWDTAANIMERHAEKWSRGKAGGGRTAKKLAEEIDDKKLDHRDWRIVDVGLFRKEAQKIDNVENPDADLEHTGDQRLADALSNHTYTIGDAKQAAFQKDSRYVVIPAGAADELAALAKPSGAGLRTIQKVQGIQSKVLLNTNPTFVPIQVLQNTIGATAALRGNLMAFINSHREWRKLPEDSKHVIAEQVGQSVSDSHAYIPKYGSTVDNSLTRGYNKVFNSDQVLKYRQGFLNPLNWNPWMDGKQNLAFRRTVFINEAKRNAGKRMGTNAEAARKGMPPIMDVLKMEPGPAKAKALREIEPEIVKVAEHINDWMGDFTRYTARERKYLRSFLLFYGFLRFATKLAFYTLPVKHPIATAIGAKLGTLHNDEVIDLLSNQAAQQGVSKKEAEEELRKNGFPDSFGRIYLTDDGKLRSIDLARLNPLSSPLVEAAGNPKQAAFGLLSPALQALADLGYGKSSFTGKDLNTQGFYSNSRHKPTIGLGESARYVTRTLSRTAWPVRAADDILSDRPQGDDSLPILRDRPLVPMNNSEREKYDRWIESHKTAGTRAMRLVPLTSRPDSLPLAISGSASSKKFHALEKQKQKLLAAKPAKKGDQGRWAIYLYKDSKGKKVYGLTPAAVKISDATYKLKKKPTTKTIRPAKTEEQKLLDKIKRLNEGSPVDDQLDKIRKMQAGY